MTAYALFYAALFVVWFVVVCNAPLQYLPILGIGCFGFAFFLIVNGCPWWFC